MCHLKGSFEFNCGKSQFYPQVRFIFSPQQRREEEWTRNPLPPFSSMQIDSNFQSSEQIGSALRQISLQFDRMNNSRKK